MQHKNPLLESTIKLKEYFQECQKVTPDLKKLDSFVKMGINLTLKDENEKTGLDYICEKKNPQPEAALILIEARCPVSREDAYQLIEYSIHQKCDHRLVLLLLVNCVDQEDLYPVIKPFAKINGNGIQKFMHLLVSVNEYMQMEILLMLPKLLIHEQDAELIMEALSEHYAEESKSDCPNTWQNTLALEEIVDLEDEDRLQFDLELSPRESEPFEFKQKFDRKASPVVNFSLYPSINTQGQKKQFENKKKIHFKNQWF